MNEFNFPKIELMVDTQPNENKSTKEDLFNESLIKSKKNLSELFPKQIDFVRRTENHSLKFFFFGCWNNDQTVVEKVMKNIIDDTDIQFGIVNGDNYYHNKKNGEKHKFDDIAKVDRGFNMLKEFKKDIYLTLGNHEVNFDESDSVDKVCRILLREIEIIQHSNIQLPNNYYSVTFKHQYSDQKTKFVFLDANLMDTNECYEEHSRMIELDNMIDWFKRTVYNTPQNVGLIIVGHLPLFHLKKVKNPKDKKDKKKKENKTIQIDINETTQNILDVLIGQDPTLPTLPTPEIFTPIQFVKEMKPIFNILANLDRDIYYLALDTHNYQHIVHKNITEIIIGTAGADLDDVEIYDYRTNNNNPIEKMMDGVNEPFYIYKTLREHGHAVFETTHNNKLTYNFILANLNESKELTYSTESKESTKPSKSIESIESHELNNNNNNMLGGSKHKFKNSFDIPKLAYDTHAKKMKKTFLV